MVIVICSKMMIVKTMTKGELVTLERDVVCLKDKQAQLRGLTKLDEGKRKVYKKKLTNVSFAMMSERNL